MTPLAGFNVSLPQSPTRGAVSRHGEEATQPAPGTPSRTQRENPPRLSQMPTQPTEWTPTSTKDNGITSKTPPRHSQENTQPAPPQHTEPFYQCRDRKEEERVAESLAQYQRTGECRIAHITDAAQLFTRRRRDEDHPTEDSCTHVPLAPTL